MSTTKTTKARKPKQPKADIVRELADALRGNAKPAEMVVAIRNVSSTGVSIVKGITGLDRDITLPADYEYASDVPPVHYEIIPWTAWQRIRKGYFVANGLVIRDDALLSEYHAPAPKDESHEIHPEFAKNVVADPRAWISKKTEDEIREGIAKMTSEASLRRLEFEVNRKILELGEESGAAPLSSERGQYAMRRLPAVYRLVDELVTERLDELQPMYGKRGEEKPYTNPMRDRPIIPRNHY